MENFDYVSTIYGEIDGDVITDIPSGRKYKIRGSYRKLKPTWFNVGLNWFEEDYTLIKIFNIEVER